MSLMNPFKSPCELSFKGIAHVETSDNRRRAIVIGIGLLILGVSGWSGPALKAGVRSKMGKDSPPVAHLLEPTGPHKIGTVLYDWTDGAREEQWSATLQAGRELLVQVWYPTDDIDASRPVPYVPDSDRIRASLDKDWPEMPLVKTHAAWGARLSTARKRYPLLIFSHGMNSARFYYTGLMEELASHGYIVAAIDHTFWGPGVAFPSGRVVQFEDGMEARDQLSPDEYDQMMWAGVSVMVADEVFVEHKMVELNSNSTAANLFHNRLNLSQVGAIGHSMGGYAATRACLEYTVFKACASLDGLNQFLYLRPTASSKPFLLLLNSASGTQVISQSLAKRYLASYGEPRVFIVDGTKHNSFSDVPILSPVSRAKAPSDPDKAHRVITAELVAFLDRAFGSETSKSQGIAAPAGLIDVDLRQLAKGKPAGAALQ